MKATIHYFSQPAVDGADYQAEDICITVFLPFIPHPGMTLKVTPEGEFYRVDEVYWDISAPDEVVVYLEEPEEGEELEPWAAMQDHGWRIL